jgi:hypothetical protein
VKFRLKLRDEIQAEIQAEIQLQPILIILRLSRASPNYFALSLFTQVEPCEIQAEIQAEIKPESATTNTHHPQAQQSITK